MKTTNKSALLKLSIPSSLEAEEAVSEVLLELFGQPGSSYHDIELGTVTASIYLERTADWNATTKSQLEAGLKRIRSSGLTLGKGSVTAEKVRREDWAESWKRHFKPISIGSALLVKPSWVKRKPKPGQAVVVLDPGLSFGTGQHPTTRFCLQQVVAAAKTDRCGSFLDIGTGSGILPIAAAKLGIRRIDAFDFDPDCVRISKGNAVRNRVGHRMKIFRGDLTKLPHQSRQRYDLVCANLIYDLLLAERERILNRLAPDGVLVLAGILRTQFAEVRGAYEKAGMKLIVGRQENEWESGAFTRHSAG
ncbi:MAG: 50S ribosomal protein L11 methyltransferase [Verrucomicrobia bacterium]|nr:50S ribosomal protein L11 methyltransferase [Verrucomicrobiota bacterium]